MKKDLRLTVGQLKKLLKAYNVPDNAIVCCQSDEEGNREMVCCDMFIDLDGNHTAGYKADTALEQITALEQKDHFANASKKVEQKDK